MAIRDNRSQTEYRLQAVLEFKTGAASIATTDIDMENYEMGANLMVIPTFDENSADDQSFTISALKQSTTAGGTYTDVPTDSLIGALADLDVTMTEAKTAGQVFQTLGLLGVDRFIEITVDITGTLDGVLGVGCAIMLNGNSDLLEAENI